MVEEDFGGVQVDVCKNGCKGIWFDWQELIRLDENHEGAGRALEEALKSPRVNDADREQLKCPKCGLAMHAHKYSSAKEVNVDECYGCGGFFLDSGELREMRDNYMSEEERDAYVQNLLDEMPEYKAMEEEMKVQKVKQRTAAGTKFGKIIRKAMFFPIP
jgi:Zn-finger nucleic acid-binding protein